MCSVVCGQRDEGLKGENGEEAMVSRVRYTQKKIGGKKYVNILWRGEVSPCSVTYRDWTLKNGVWRKEMEPRGDHNVQGRKQAREMVEIDYGEDRDWREEPG